MISKKPCLAPLTSVQISPQGHLAPCCWYSGRFNKTQHSIKDMSIQEYRKNILFPMFEEMENGNYHNGCSKCLTNGRTRVDYYETLYGNDRDIITTDRPLRTMDLRLGNLCNISCITCTSYNSNYFYKVKEKGYYTWKDQVKYRGTQDWIENSNVLEDIKKNLNTVDLIYFTGGEPTINAGVHTILQHLIDIGRTDVTIEINTNLTNTNSEFINLMRNFRWKIMMSVDAIGDLNDIIRWPSKFKSIEKNIQTYLDLGTPEDRFVFVPTISIFNFFKLPEILDWMLAYNKKYPNLNFFTAKNFNILHQPEWMNLGNIPVELYEDQLKKIPSPYDEEFKNKIYTHPYVKCTKTSMRYKDWDWDKILEETKKYFESRGYDPSLTGIPNIK